MNKHPVEKYVLAAALVVLALGASALAYFFPSKPDIYGASNDRVMGQAPEALADEDMAQLISEWQTPAVWQDPGNDHRLFVSESILYDGDSQEQQLLRIRDAGDMPISSRITLRWAKEYNLDINDREIFRYDPDGDGFYNLLEFDGETNPVDPESHPPFLTRLRLRDIQVKPYRVTFQSNSELNNELIFWIDLPSPGDRPRTKALKVGDQIPGTEWVIIDFKPNQVTEMDPTINIERTFDRSELKLKRSDVNLTATLVRGKEGNLDEVTADFMMLMPDMWDGNSDIRVTRGQSFALPQVPETEYQLFEARDDAAVIIDAENRRITVPRVKIEEVRLVPGYKEPEEDSLLGEEFGY
ncbi:MAG: Amuc_1099 family pilus-like system protein [Verrucomicrobiota bacterium]